jgi:predicted nucleic acid-binding protein
VSDVRYLADTSAITRLTRPEVDAALAPLVEAGLVATCAVVNLTLLSMLRDPDDIADIQRSGAAAFQWLPTEDADLRRALDLHALFVEKGDHRVDWPALVIAAVAEHHKIPVLHYDPAFALIGEATGQRMQWIVPEGSLDAHGIRI